MHMYVYSKVERDGSLHIYICVCGRVIKLKKQASKQAKIDNERERRRKQQRQAAPERRRSKKRRTQQQIKTKSSSTVRFFPPPFCLDYFSKSLTAICLFVCVVVIVSWLAGWCHSRSPAPFCPSPPLHLPRCVCVNNSIHYPLIHCRRLLGGSLPPPQTHTHKHTPPPNTLSSIPPPQQTHSVTPPPPPPPPPP